METKEKGVGNSSILVTPPPDGTVSSKGKTDSHGSFVVDEKGEQVTKEPIGTVSEVPVHEESTTGSSNTSEAAGHESTSGQ